jgi:hypothetical protein
MYSRGNNKWNRKDAELGKEKLLKELKEEKLGWTNIYRSEEDFEYLEKDLNRLIDEEELRQDNN